MNAYERIAALIRYLDMHRGDQPDLDTIAAQVGLSRFHVHRLFAEWAGVTPKDFLQCLTVEHAKARLREGESVLRAALDAGLSGPSRLHDLCVSLEAATPGEIKAQGEGLTITAGFADTPFGASLVASTPRGVCRLAFVDDSSRATAEAELREDWPRARIEWSDDAAAKVVGPVFVRDADAKRAVRAHCARTCAARTSKSAYGVRCCASSPARSSATVRSPARSVTRRRRVRSAVRSRRTRSPC
jgi:AraC family transcriptional regulator of adaptative response/methylated-DNA-[protein]-cysteine methyltransferase